MLVSTTTGGQSATLDGWFLGRPDDTAERLLRYKKPNGWIAPIVMLAFIWCCLLLALLLVPDLAYWLVLPVILVAAIALQLYDYKRGRLQRLRDELIAERTASRERNLSFRVLRPDLAAPEALELHKAYVDLYFHRMADLDECVRNPYLDDEVRGGIEQVMIKHAKPLVLLMGYAERYTAVRLKEQDKRAQQRLREADLRLAARNAATRSLEELPPLPLL